jgi:hypothetical protein
MHKPKDEVEKDSLDCCYYDQIFAGDQKPITKLASPNSIRHLRKLLEKKQNLNHLNT